MIIADSPARVKTGALVNLGSDSLPVDGTDKVLELATLQALETLRFSVPMWYPDYDGLYWSDGRTLDVEGGDYQIIEYLRIAGTRQKIIAPVVWIGLEKINVAQLMLDTVALVQQLADQLASHTPPSTGQPTNSSAIAQSSQQAAALSKKYSPVIGKQPSH